MSSKITFSNINYFVSKPASEISKTELKEGVIYSVRIVNRFFPNMKIDVMVAKALPTVICDENFTIDENNIRKGTRRCFSELKPTNLKNGKLPVHVDFFKNIKEGDIIIIILHEA